MHSLERKWKIILFGSLGVAVDCLEWLLTQNEFEVLGVVCSREPRSKWRVAVGDRDMQEEAQRFSIPLLSLEDVVSLEADIGLSVRFHQILKERHLKRFHQGVVNLHGAPLPEYRGSMGDAMAILDGKDYFGSSLHWMDDGIDTGDLIAVERFPITKADTVYDLFVRGNQVGLYLIKSWLHEIMKGNDIKERQNIAMERMNCMSRTYGRKDVIKHKRVEATMSPERIWNVTRAFQFPGQEPAYMDTPAGKIYLSTRLNGDMLNMEMEGTNEYVGVRRQ